MEQWEYLTTFLRADAHSDEAKAFLSRYRPEWKNPPRYSAEALMPQLDELGSQGWELVHMEPVAQVGRNGDVLLPGGGAGEWSNTYFVVFKRRKPYSATP
jgi:hypothetical protein